MSDTEAQRPRFYTDEHIPSAVARELQRRDVDVLRCQDAGMVAAEDVDHLSLTTEQDRILVTRDDDFLKLHAAWMKEDKSHAGIVYVQRKNWDNIGLIVGDLLLLREALRPGESANMVWYI